MSKRVSNSRASRAPHKSRNRRPAPDNSQDPAHIHQRIQAARASHERHGTRTERQTELNYRRAALGKATIPLKPRRDNWAELMARGR